MLLHKVLLLVTGVTVLLAAATAFKLNTIGNSFSLGFTSVDSCDCSNSTCSCCQPISVFRFSDLACVNVTSVNSQNNIKFTLTLGKKVYINDTYTDKKPWPSCVEYDEQGTVHVCVIFYNTTFSETEVSGCLKLGVLVQAEIIIPLKCFTIPRPRAVAERGQNHENMITQK